MLSYARVLRPVELVADEDEDEALELPRGVNQGLGDDGIGWECFLGRVL